MIKKLLLFLPLIPALLSGQTLLSPDEALKIGLKNNYDILIAQNEAEADSILNTIGEAGMLPSLYLNAGASLNQGSIHQKYSNGSEITSNGVGGSNMNSGIALSWTLFDGTKMFVTKRKLAQVEMLGNYNFKAQVMNSTADILLAYYDVVRQKQQLKFTDEIISFNNERVTITETRFTVGLGPKTDLLQAKIDLNIQKENRINEELLLADAKRRLNTILARDVNTAFDVNDSIPLYALADRAQLEQKMYAGNPTLLAFKTQVEISNLSLRETRTQYFPKVVLNAGYNFTQNQNSAGFSLYNQNYGWQTGLTFSMPLYQGGKLNRQTQVARLDVESAQFRFQQASLQASLALQNALAIFDARMNGLELEKQNETMSRENMKLALERLRLGQGTAFEVTQAQSTFSETLFRLSGLEYDVKSAEINVHRQAADL